MKQITLISFVLISISLFAQKAYKDMMYDMNYNFYEVVEEAEKYFSTHDNGKGSGFKGYMRWKVENESKYYPSGERKNTDPLFTKNAYLTYQKTNSHLRSGGPGWKDLGPYDANNITSHYSPGIGRVETFEVNPANTQEIYMGSRSGGFWKTDNEGSTWTNTTDFLVASGVNTLTARPTNFDSVLINIRNGGNGASHGVYVSSNGGDTWILSDFNPTNLGWGGLGKNDQIYEIKYHPTVDNLVFVGTSRGLYRSTDGLKTWTNHLSSSDITEIDFHPTDPNYIYVYDDYYWGVNEDVVMISSDMGINFIQSDSLLNNNEATCFVETSADCPDCIYVGSSNGVWKSTNKGTSFSYLTNPNESCREFTVSDLDDQNMIYGYVDLEASTNGGTAWTQVTAWANSSPDQTYVHADLRAADCINGVFYVGTDGYLAKSTDNGGSWTRLNDGTGIRENYRVGICQSDPRIHMCGSQDNGTSILDETGWIEWNGGDGMEAIIHSLNDDWMIGSWQYGTRNRTQDAGQSRQGINTPQSGGGSADWIAPMFYDPNDHMNVYHFSDSVFLSGTFGDNWQYVGSPNIDLIQLAAISNKNSYIIAVRRSDIYLSTNGGSTWSDISSNLPGHWITDVEFDPEDDNTVIVTYNRHQNDNEKVFISHDLGGSWTNITYNIGNIPVRTVAIDQTQGKNIYAGTEIGVYTMPLGGNTWTEYNTDLPKVTIRDLKINHGANRIKAASWGRGLWETCLVGTDNHPAIVRTWITETPTYTTPRYSVDQIVTSKISYNGTLNKAYVAWSVNNNTVNNVIPMFNSLDSTWLSQNAIPTYPVGSDIYFKVVAVGSSNDTTSTDIFHYEVQDCPFIFSTKNISSCGPYTSSSGKVFTQSGSYQDTLHSISSCDSMVTLNLTIGSLNTNVNVFGNGLQAQASSGFFQWLDCDNNYAPIMNAFNPLYQPPSSGNYAVEVSDGSCKDTSICYNYVVAGINEATELKDFIVYPNPSNGQFTIDVLEFTESLDVMVYDELGKVVYTNTYEQPKSIELNLTEPAGVYYLMMDNQQKRFVLPLIIE